MNIEAFRDYCLQKKAVSEEFPFDQKTLVFKVKGKMFALTDVDSFESINLKCDPEYALELREQYDGISGGFHMNKKHWNTILVNSISNEFLYALTDHSYDLVVKSLPKKLKSDLI